MTPKDRNTLELSAKRIAEQCSRNIRSEANSAAATPSMPYREQWILERAIEILKESV